MAVTNLTNTKWRIKDSPTLSAIGQKLVNFTSNGDTFTSLTITNNGITYGSTAVYEEVYTGYVQPVNYRHFYIKINGTATDSNYDYAFTYGGSGHSPEFTVLPGDYFTVYADGEECWLEMQWGESFNVTGSPATQTGATVVTVTPTADNFIAAINTNW